MPGCVVAGGAEAPGSSEIGSDLGVLAGVGPLGVALSGDPAALFERADAVLDFTAPAATVSAAKLAAKRRIVHVIGTTGLSEADEAAIGEAARHATVIKAGNMSLGVNLLAALTRRVAQALDADFDIEIVEMHHREKVDAPSGTALMLGAAAAAGRGIDLKGHSIRKRDGHTGARARGDIGFASLRGGTVVGDHTVVFAGEGERIELVHRAADRSIFARGAVKAALWGRGKGPGLFTMTDVLGL
jgi:4-hydroxy-tetrahydrodipicolinate reductase